MFSRLAGLGGLVAASIGLWIGALVVSAGILALWVLLSLVEPRATADGIWWTLAVYNLALGWMVPCAVGVVGTATVGGDHRVLAAKVAFVLLALQLVMIVVIGLLGVDILLTS